MKKENCNKIHCDHCDQAEGIWVCALSNRSLGNIQECFKYLVKVGQIVLPKSMEGKIKESVDVPEWVRKSQSIKLIIDGKTVNEFLLDIPHGVCPDCDGILKLLDKTEGFSISGDSLGELELLVCDNCEKHWARPPTFMQLSENPPPLIGLVWHDPNQFSIMGIKTSKPPTPICMDSYEQILSIRWMQDHVNLIIHQYPFEPLAQTKRHVLLIHLMERLSQSRGYLEGDKDTPNFMEYLFKYCKEVLDIPEIESKVYLKFH